MFSVPWSIQKLLLTFEIQALKLLTVFDKFDVVDNTESASKLTFFNQTTLLVRLELTALSVLWSDQKLLLTFERHELNYEIEFSSDWKEALDDALHEFTSAINWFSDDVVVHKFWLTFDTTSVSVLLLE